MRFTSIDAIDARETTHRSPTARRSASRKSSRASRSSASRRRRCPTRTQTHEGRVLFTVPLFRPSSSATPCRLRLRSRTAPSHGSRSSSECAVPSLRRPRRRRAARAVAATKTRASAPGRRPPAAGDRLGRWPAPAVSTGRRRHRRVHRRRRRGHGLRPRLLRQDARLPEEPRHFRCRLRAAGHPVADPICSQPHLFDPVLAR